jgi:hypothetical protein
MRRVRRVRIGAAALTLLAGLTLAPMAALADAQHDQAEVANAQAQLTLAQDQAAALQQQAELSAANDRAIGILQSTEFRQRQLANVANGAAIEQLAAALANAKREAADANAVNDRMIAQNIVAGIMARADANLANALAQNRPTEIANARAMWMEWRHIADLIAGPQLDANISNEKQIAQEQADAIEGPAVESDANDEALGANDLLSADVALQASDVAAISDVESASFPAAELISHAEASLANAEAMAAEGR